MYCRMKMIAQADMEEIDQSIDQQSYHTNYTTMSTNSTVCGIPVSIWVSTCDVQFTRVYVLTIIHWRLQAWNLDRDVACRDITATLWKC